MASFESQPSERILSRPYSEADFDGSHAAPLLIIGASARKSLVRNQDRMAENFREVARFELADYADPATLEYVGDSIKNRMAQREGLNGNEYIRRLHRFPKASEVPDAQFIEVYWACYQALYGKGSAKQNDMARRAFGMASVEYKNLTIVGDFRREEEVPMWDEVAALVDRDVTPHFDEMANFRVLGFDRDMSEKDYMDPKYVRAMRIGMKRDLGTLDDGTLVKARTTAIINGIDTDGYSRADFEAIHEAQVANIDMALVPEFMRVARYLIEEDQKSGVVLARNETTYGLNKTALAAIEDRRSDEAKQRELLFKRRNPAKFKLPTSSPQVVTYGRPYTPSEASE